MPPPPTPPASTLLVPAPWDGATTKYRPTDEHYSPWSPQVALQLRREVPGVSEAHQFAGVGPDRADVLQRAGAAVLQAGSPYREVREEDAVSDRRLSHTIKISN